MPSPAKTTRRVQGLFARVRDSDMPVDLAAKRLAKLIGCSRSTVYRWIGHGHKDSGRPVQARMVRAVESALDDLESEIGI